MPADAKARPAGLTMNKLTMGKRADSAGPSDPEDSDTEEDEREACCSKIIVSHTASPRQCWDIIVAILLIYLALCLPFIFAFVPNQPAALGSWDQFVDIIFWIDIPINFITTFESEEGDTVSDPSLIVKNYLTGWFVIDVVSGFPFDRVSNNGLARFSKLIKILRMMKFMKMVRMSKLARMLPKLQANLEISNATLTIAKFMVFIFLTAHWLGCFLFIVSRWGDFRANSWVSVYLDPHGVQFEDKDASIGSMYLAALYWAITTMSTIGYGDITPGTDAERVFVIIGMCMGAGIFAYGLTNMCTLVFNLNEREIRFNSLQDNMQRFLMEKKSPPEFKKKIKRFLFFRQVRSTVDAFNTNDEMLMQLSPYMRSVIRLGFYDSLFLTVPLMPGTKWPELSTNRLAMRIAELLKGVCFPPREYITVLHESEVHLNLIAVGDIRVEAHFSHVGGLNGLRIKHTEYEKAFHVISSQPKVVRPVSRARSSRSSKASRSGSKSSFSAQSVRAYGVTAVDLADLKGPAQFDLTTGASFGEVSAVLGVPATFSAWTLSSVDIYRLKQSDIFDLFVDSEFPEFKSAAVFRVLDKWADTGSDFRLQAGSELVDVMLQTLDTKEDLTTKLSSNQQDVSEPQSANDRTKSEAALAIKAAQIEETSDSCHRIIPRGIDDDGEADKMLKKVARILHDAHANFDDSDCDQSSSSDEYDSDGELVDEIPEVKTLRSAMAQQHKKLTRLTKIVSELAAQMQENEKMISTALLEKSKVERKKKYQMRSQRRKLLKQPIPEEEGEVVDVIEEAEEHKHTHLPEEEDEEEVLTTLKFHVNSESSEEEQEAVVEPEPEPVVELEPSSS